MRQLNHTELIGYAILYYSTKFHLISLELKAAGTFRPPPPPLQAEPPSTSPGRIGLNI